MQICDRTCIKRLTSGAF